MRNLHDLFRILSNRGHRLRMAKPFAMRLGLSLACFHASVLTTAAVLSGDKSRQTRGTSISRWTPITVCMALAGLARPHDRTSEDVEPDRQQLIQQRVARHSVDARTDCLC